MASLYNLEPPPTAKVLLTTTSGDLLLELFAKQTPLASRSFLQHCLDGYYNNTVFHRLVPGFILQGGDPTGTGDGGESIYDGGTFENEFHTRLKWNRRGLLGMANEGKKNTNGSQFFLTLGDCKELEGQNTMFGRVVGDTVFNMLKMGDAELGEGERPLYPTRITGAEVLVNPFEDMVKRDVKRVEVGKEEKAMVKKSKRKAGQTLLSFGGGEGEEEGPVVKKAKFNPMLIDVKEESAPKQSQSISRSEAKATVKSAETVGHSKPTEKKLSNPTKRRSSPSRSPPPRKQPAADAQLPLPNEEVPSGSPSSLEPVEKMASLLDQTNAQIAEMKASMKRTILTSPVKEPKQSALEMMIPATAVRGKKRKNGEKQTLDLLGAFKSKLAQAPAEPVDAVSLTNNTIINDAATYGNSKRAADDNNEEALLCDLHFIANCQSCESWDENAENDAADDEDKGWMSHVLSFEKDRLGKDLTWKRKNEEELMVIDPREKAQGIKEEQRAKKIARAEGKGTAWARDRDKGKEPRRRAGEKG